MALETATYISQLVSSNPTATDPVGQGDDHLRLIKAALQATLPNWTAAALNSTQAQIDNATAVAAGTNAGVMNAGTVGAPGLAVAGSLTTGLFSDTANTLSIGTAGAKALQVNADQSVTFEGNTTTVGSQVVDGNSTISGNLTVTGAITGGGAVLVGEPRMWLSDTLPSGGFGWLNGQAISRTLYPVLFALWGTTYGTGNGTTTFNVPNMQGVVPIGKNGMGGATAANLVTLTNANVTGSIIGAQNATLSQANLPNITNMAVAIPSGQGSHSHSLPESTFASGGTYLEQFGGSTANLYVYASTNAATLPAMTGTASTGGSDTPFSIVQPSMVVNYITLLG